MCWCILCTFCVLFCALAQNVHSCGCGCVPHILLSLIHAGHSVQLGGGITTGPACTLGQQRAPPFLGEQKFGKTPKCSQLRLWLCATYFVKPNTRRALGSTRGRYHNWSCVHTWQQRAPQCAGGEMLGAHQKVWLCGCGCNPLKLFGLNHTRTCKQQITLKVSNLPIGKATQCFLYC